MPDWTFEENIGGVVEFVTMGISLIETLKLGAYAPPYEPNSRLEVERELYSFPGKLPSGLDWGEL